LSASNYGEAIKLIKQQIHESGTKLFSFRCDKTWHSLEKTEDDKTRFCMDCHKHVYSVHSSEEFYSRARNGQCVFIAFDPSQKLESSDVCVIDHLELDEELGMPEAPIIRPVASEFVQYLKLLIEQKNYEKLTQINLEFLKESFDKHLGIAFREIRLNNYEKALKHIEDYLFFKEMEEYGKEEIERINPIKKEPHHKRSENLFFNDRNDSFCPACQQDPCMCSDPF
jgi:Zn finger protein HypA/HybF involved in hydrogenase expression